MTKERKWQTQRQQETKGRVREQDRDGNGEKLAFMRLWVGLPNMIINRLVLIFLCQSCPWLVAEGGSLVPSLGSFYRPTESSAQSKKNVLESTAG